MERWKAWAGEDREWARSVLQEAGAIEECGNHSGIYYEGQFPVENAFSLINARLMSGEMALTKGQTRREVIDLLRFVYHECSASDSCPECGRRLTFRQEHYQPLRNCERPIHDDHSERRPMKDVSETIEFFTPELGLEVEPYIEVGHKQGIHHLARYHWACIAIAQIRPARILDIACGAGYGTYLLAIKFPNAEVFGVDYDERAVEYARSKYSAENLKYVHGDVVRWTSGSSFLGRFDAITSFDTLEHLLHRELALQKFADNLRQRGALLLSTPCAHSTSRLYPAWEHHKVEYGYRELYALLKRFFNQVAYPGEPQFVGLDYWQTVINGKQVLYHNCMNPVICSGPIRSEPLPRPVL